MKKAISFIFTVLIVLFNLNQLFAQLPDGSYAKNFIMTDIAGNIQNLYSYTDSGKTVILDFSAVNCGPCWDYHQSGELEDYYNNYGPSGDNSSMAFWIEANGNPLECLQGNGCSTYGDWTDGTPYPMILTAPPNSYQVTEDYAINFLLTVYNVCPDRTLTQLGPYAQNISAVQLHAATLSCPPLSNTNNDVRAFSAIAPDGLCGTPKLTIQNYGNTTLISCTILSKVDGDTVNTTHWSGSLAKYEIEQVTLPAIVGITGGTHNLEIEIINPNDTIDENTSNNIITKSFYAVSVVAIPFLEGFVDAVFPPAGWILNNPNNDEATWARSIAGGFGLSTGSAKMDFFNSIPDRTDDLIISPLDLSTVSTANMTFNIAYAQYWDGVVGDTLKLLASSDCGNTWQTVWAKQSSSLTTATATESVFTPNANQWRTETVDLNSFAGESKVFFKFHAISNWGNNCYIDDINISQSSGVKEVSNTNFINVFPNPSSNYTTVEILFEKSENINLAVYNMLGKKVLTLDNIFMKTGSNTININTQGLDNGVYFMNLYIGGKIFTEKITISNY